MIEVRCKHSKNAIVKDALPRGRTVGKGLCFFSNYTPIVDYFYCEKFEL